MTFKTLAERFEASLPNIYSQYQQMGEQPYINILPNKSTESIRRDTRSVPDVSTEQDNRRISRFLQSNTGTLFLRTQTQLQTGNTFIQTRKFNSDSILQNVRPFTHARRHSSSNEIKNVLFGGASGLLQNDTVDTLTTRFVVAGAVGAILNNRGGLSGLKNIALNAGASFVATKLKKEINKYIPQTFQNSRPEYKVFGYTPGLGALFNIGASGPVVFDPQPLDQRGTVRTSLKATVKAQLQSFARQQAAKAASKFVVPKLPKVIQPLANNFIPQLSGPEKIPAFVDAAKQFKANFYKNSETLKKPGTVPRLRSAYISDGLDSESLPGTPGVDPSNKNIPTKLTNIKDVYNLRQSDVVRDNLGNDEIDYRNIITSIENKYRLDRKDIINFTFREVNNVDGLVKFRALISNIKESVKPEFNEQRYVGRAERFVTYAGVKRTVNLNFNVVAFSQDEHEGMWSRINYLTGLTFPKRPINGFMVPPLFNISIGGIYDNQPCYIETLDFDFLDENTTFDILKEVPFAIAVNMQITLLEKRSKFFDSPFYKVTEAIAEEQLQSVQGSVGEQKVLNNQQAGTVA